MPETWLSVKERGRGQNLLENKIYLRIKSTSSDKNVPKHTIFCEFLQFQKLVSSFRL